MRVEYATDAPRVMTACCISGSRLGELGRRRLLQLQLKLRRTRAGRRKTRRIERPVAHRVETEPASRDLEARADRLRVRTAPTHARAEVRIVLATAARVAHERHHVLGPLRIMLCQPLFEEILHLVRKAQ